jgi:hypothetical protein
MFDLDIAGTAPKKDLVGALEQHRGLNETNIHRQSAFWTRLGRARRFLQKSTDLHDGHLFVPGVLAILEPVLNCCLA